MTRTRLSAALLAAASLASAAALADQRHPLPIGDVVKMSGSTSSADQVIDSIRASATTYALRGSDYAKLKAAGVSDAVLDYLQQSLVDDFDLLTRYWALGGDLGGCGFCYPQPVDIGAMRSGYDAVDVPPPTHHPSGKPPGTPSWVPFPRAGVTGERLSVNDVVQMAKSGMQQDEIVRRVESAHLDHVTGTGSPGAVRSHPIAGLGGAQLARLKDQGVSDAVLDALQGQFLAAFIESQRLRYQNWGKGSRI